MQLLTKFVRVFMSENRSISPKVTKSESKRELQLVGEGKLCSVSFEGSVRCAKNSVIPRLLVNEGEEANHETISTLIL